MNSSATAIGSKEIVSRFIQFLNDEQFDQAKNLADESLEFKGVLGERHGAESYFADMQKMKLKYDIHEIISEGEWVSVLYDVVISGKKIYTAGWYQVYNGKIRNIKVIFDPRPVFDTH